MRPREISAALLLSLVAAPGVASTGCSKVVNDDDWHGRGHGHGRW